MGRVLPLPLLLIKVVSSTTAHTHFDVVPNISYACESLIHALIERRITRVGRWADLIKLSGFAAKAILK